MPLSCTLHLAQQAKGGEASGTKGALKASLAVEKEAFASEPHPPEPPLEYTDATGKLKFNKRPPSSKSVEGAVKRNEGGQEKKKAKRTKLAKLNNAKLLSFGDDEDG